jgi:hypothetical protein
MENLDFNKKLINIMESSIQENRLKDVIQDAMDMSKQEFEAQYGDSFDYDQILQDYGDDAQSESFDPAMEPSQQEEQYNLLITAYENGEEDLAEVLGLSMQELDQEMTEFAMDHNLHMDDDRDEVVHGYIEQVVDQADYKDHGEYESVEEDEVEVDELAMPCGAEVETDQEEERENVSYSKTKSKGDATVTVSANASSMQELHAVLKLAGITLPKQEEPEAEVSGDEEPEIAVIGDVGDDDGNRPTMEFPKTDVDPNMTQDKSVLTSVIRDKLRDYLKNSQR